MNGDQETLSKVQNWTDSELEAELGDFVSSVRSYPTKPFYLISRSAINAYSQKLCAS